MLYSPNRRSFITKTATTNFKADEFTDPVGKSPVWYGATGCGMVQSGLVWYGAVQGSIEYSIPFLCVELRALATLLGPYGMKYLGDRMLQQIASQMGEVKVGV
jgi:hypothetical protein